jgi:hypothetical protein
VNNLLVSLVLPGMCTDSEGGPAGPGGPGDGMGNVTGGRFRRWRPRRRGGGGLGGRVPGADVAGGRAAAVPAAPGEVVAVAVQLAIGLLTASLDSPELAGWAVDALTPHDADGLGNFLAGLHVVSQRLLHELHEATGEQPEDILQRLAILAEHWRGMPSAG